MNSFCKPLRWAMHSQAEAGARAASSTPLGTDRTGDLYRPRRRTTAPTATTDARHATSRWSAAWRQDRIAHAAARSWRSGGSPSWATMSGRGNWDPQRTPGESSGGFGGGGRGRPGADRLRLPTAPARSASPPPAAAVQPQARPRPWRLDLERKRLLRVEQPHQPQRRHGAVAGRDRRRLARARCAAGRRRSPCRAGDAAVEADDAFSTAAPRALAPATRPAEARMVPAMPRCAWPRRPPSTTRTGG